MRRKEGLLSMETNDAEVFLRMRRKEVQFLRLAQSNADCFNFCTDGSVSASMVLLFPPSNLENPMMALRCLSLPSLSTE